MARTTRIKRKGERSAAPASEPTAERRRHGRVSRSADQVVDSAGAIGRPWNTEGLLARLERRGDISGEERQAGEMFAELFHRASLDDLHASNPARVLAASRGNGVGLSDSAEAARGRLSQALEALGGRGSPCGTCAWFVLGTQLAVRDWAVREGWRGRSISEHVAKGILLGCLGLLAQHFGVGRQSEHKRA